jgi:hypothetical protein
VQVRVRPQDAAAALELIEAHDPGPGDPQKLRETDEDV